MTIEAKKDLVQEIRAAAGDPGALTRLLDHKRAEDIAEAVHDLTDGETVGVFAALEEAQAADFLFHIGPSSARYVIAHSPRERIARLLDLMPTDDAAYVVSETEPREADALLDALEARAPEDAANVRSLLAFEEKTAGRLMTDKFVRLTPDLTVEEAFDAVRAADSQVETVNTLYVIGSGAQPLGVLSMRELLRAHPKTSIGAIMTRDLVTVDVDTDQEEVARLISKYDFMTMPVLGREGELLGIITVDDVIDVLVEEFNEDVAKMVGTDADEMDRRSPAQVARMRLPWLIGTMGIELFAGLVISRFDYVLKEVILLASFMPVISAISGNVGLQAAAIVVRGLDTGHVTMNNQRSAVRKEVLSTIIMAIACGLLLGTVGAIWDRHAFFGVVIGIAMSCSMLTAGFMGTVIPILSKRMGFDPATTAGPFETAFQDVIGFAVLLWVASLLLPWLK